MSRYYNPYYTKNGTLRTKTYKARIPDLSRTISGAVNNIGRISASLRNYKRTKERQAAVNYSIRQGDARRTESEYSVSEIYYDPKTKKTKIVFLEEWYYRIIVRYVQQDYVRYPIFSDWMPKSKTITKVIYLTNSNLENLENDSDSLIRTFAVDIINMIDDLDAYPSWYVIKYYNDRKEEEINKINSSYEAKINECNRMNSYIDGQLQLFITKMNSNYKNIKQLNKKLKSLCKKKQNIKKFNSIGWIVLTLGIVNLFASKAKMYRYDYMIKDLEKELEATSFINQKYPLFIETLKREKETNEGLVNIYKEERDSLICKAQYKTAIALNFIEVLE